MAAQNDMMLYFNVSLFGLRGKLHPALNDVTTSHGVKKMRHHIKMLSGDYLTFEQKSNQSGGSPFCQNCDDKSEPESLEHLISKCIGHSEVRSRIKNQMINICQEAGLGIDVNSLSSAQFTQFLLDPSSMNLKKRVNINHPSLSKLFQLSRDFCFSIDRTRTKAIKS